MVDNKIISDWEPDIRTLRSFVTIAKERNITRAANRLHIAQPALSRKIAILERELDLALFERSVRGVDLTPADKILLDWAYAIFGQLAQTFHDVTASSERPAGTVVVGMPPTPGEFIAPPLLRRIKDHFPEIELRFREGFSRALDKSSYTLAEASALPLIMPSRTNYLRLLADQHAESIGRTLNIVQRADGV